MAEPNADSTIPEAGDECSTPRNAHEWFMVLYQELKRMAHGELFRHKALTLGPVTLLHETWIRFNANNLEFATQQDLIRYAARMMRGIVIDHIRERNSLKRGGEYEFTPYQTLDDLRTLTDDQAMRISDALDELARLGPRLAELVELKFFSGLTFGEIAALHEVSERTVQRDWEKARALLFSSLSS